jgi:hypothetical protein
MLQRPVGVGHVVFRAVAAGEALKTRQAGSYAEGFGERARVVAAETMRDVKDAMGLGYA